MPPSALQSSLLPRYPVPMPRAPDTPRVERMVARAALPKTPDEVEAAALRLFSPDADYSILGGSDLWKTKKGWKRRFLHIYAQTGVIRTSARKAGVAPGTIQINRKRDPVFAAALRIAESMFLETLDSEAIRRGRDGWEEPVFGKDGEIGTRRRYSDRLLELALKAKHPDYQNTSPAPVQIDNRSVTITIGPAEREALKQKLQTMIERAAASQLTAAEPQPSAINAIDTIDTIDADVVEEAADG